MLRWFVSALISALFTLLLFFLMYKMIESDESKLAQESTYKLVDFIYAKREVRDVEKKHELPPQPKKKPLPPKESKALHVNKSTPTQAPTTSLSMQMPSLQTSGISAGVMPSIGRMSEGSGESELSAIMQINPMYPPRAKRMGIEGYVVVEIHVDEKGEVEDVSIKESHPEGVFDRAVIRAVGRWQFKPKMHNSIAQKQVGTMRLNFSLDK